MPTERCRENKRPIHTWPHPMSWPCHCPCPCPVQVTVAVTELIIRMVWCMSRHAQPRLNFILSWQHMFIIYFYNCSWYCWYLCGACIDSELVYVWKRSSLVDVVWGSLQVYTINQRDQCSLRYVLQSYLVEPAIVRFESDSFQLFVAASAHVI